MKEAWLCPFFLPISGIIHTFLQSNNIQYNDQRLCPLVYYLDMTIQKPVSSWFPSEHEEDSHAVLQGKLHLSSFWSLHSHQVWAGQFRIFWGVSGKTFKIPAFRIARTWPGGTCHWCGKGACSKQLSFQCPIFNSSETKGPPQNMSLLSQTLPPSLTSTKLTVVLLNLSQDLWRRCWDGRKQSSVACLHHLQLHRE